MNKRAARTGLIVGGVAAVTAAAILLPARQAAGQSCYAVSPATDPPQNCIVMNDPDAAGMAIWGVRGGRYGGTPETEWFDYEGNPIATLGQTGGFKVYGDQVCVYGPRNVFLPVACLKDNGTVVVGGQVLTPSDIAWLHAARAGHTPTPGLHPWSYSARPTPDGRAGAGCGLPFWVWPPATMPSRHRVLRCCGG